MEDRTEDATPKRREEARQEGRIARSQELTTAAMLLGAAGVVTLVGATLATGLRDIMAYGLTGMAAAPGDADGAFALLRTMGGRAFTLLMTAALAMATIALTVTAAQARGTFTTKPLEPKWERINPVANGRRLLGKQPWVELARSLLKLTIVGFAAWTALRAAWPDLISLSQLPVAAIPAVLQRHVVRLCLTAGLSYLALALADYAYQLWQHAQSLRMTKTEVKQEHKQQEGDPMLKARRRSVARAYARRQMFREVKKADVVITNPTHIAVALRYDPGEAPAPVVLAMGQRKIAERIKALAAEAGVPMVENRPLARALLATARVGTIIPAELYAAVAEILAFVIRARHERATYRPAGARSRAPSRSRSNS
jgi:flagellar biosynthetic protein FlhB